MLVVFLLLLSAVILELYVMVQVASVIGALPTVLLVVAISVVGAWLTKIEGLGVLRRMQRTVQAGELPADEAVDGLLVSTGGLLMLVPGFVSGAIGFLLLLPPVRALVRPFTRGRIRRRFGRAGTAGVFGAGVYNADSHLFDHPTGFNDPSGPSGSARPQGPPPELEA